MTDDEIRIAVAECCGWVKVRAHWEKDGECAFLNDSINHRQLPNYPADLNACAEMEKTLGPTERKCYVDYLMSDFDSYEAFFDALTSDARQRCEAFLKVKGLWKP